MSLFGVIMLFITMGWTAFLMIIIAITGDVIKFLQGPGAITFIAGYIAIVLVFIIAKKIVQSM